MACLRSQMSSATDASRKRWNSRSGAEEAGKSTETPLTVSLADELCCSTLSDHQVPARSSSANVDVGVFVFQVSSPQTLSKWRALSAEVRSDAAPCCRGRAKDFARSKLAAEAKRISKSPSTPMDKSLGRDMQPAQPAALNSVSGRFSGIQPQRMRLPWESN